MKQTKSRWGFTEPYNVPAAAPQKEIKIDKTVDAALDASSKAVRVLENIANSTNNENEGLRRTIQLKDNEILTLKSRLNDAYSQNQALSDKLDAAKAVNSLDKYAMGGITRPVSDYDTQAYTQSVAAPVYIPTPSIGIRASDVISKSYVQPVNPMTVFVEFLEELNILEDYIEKLTLEGMTMENVCTQYSPSEYISDVCTDDDCDILDGWDEADDLWLSICESDNLDELEAYIE